jgi:hypothetical protein
MRGKVQCSTHGQSSETFVCSHLRGDAASLGFNRGEATDDNPFPDAWCDDCELIRAAHGGWNEQSEKLVEITLLCSGCYKRARIRNTKTSVTLDDLADLRWKCGDCDEWHTGPCLDFGYDAPDYWLDEHQGADRKARLRPNWSEKRPETFLNEDFCAIEDTDFFVRGIIELPIIGTAETLRWGVWGSLSRENFEKLLNLDDEPARDELPPMFSWLSTSIPEYPQTLSLKMYAHVQEPNQRPSFEMELTDHPLAQEYHNGISPERVKQIVMGRLRGSD